MIKIPQIIKAVKDFGPINISVFLMYLYIKTPIMLKMPNKINVMPIFFIFLAPFRIKKQPPILESCLIDLTYLNPIYLLSFDHFILKTHSRRTQDRLCGIT